jgi:[protein-PII] uridylyltransferase
VTTLDRPGLVAAIAGVFALHDLSVLEGRFATRADGVAIDSFHVVDMLGRHVAPERWVSIRTDLVGAGSGHFPLEARLAEKAHEYRHAAETGLPVRVRATTAPGAQYTVVEVSCGDRVGRLHAIGRALHEARLDVRLAKIDTRGREVVDTFMVHGPGGEPVRDGAALERIAASVRGRLETA